MSTADDCTWGTSEVNLRWYCKLLFPPGQGIVCPFQLGSASPSVTGGGSQETGQWSGRSWSRDSTVTSQMSDSLWASRTSGRWGRNRPRCRGCRRKNGEEMLKFKISEEKCVNWWPWQSIPGTNRPSTFHLPDGPLRLSNVTHSTTGPNTPTG